MSAGRRKAISGVVATGRDGQSLVSAGYAEAVRSMERIERACTICGAAMSTYNRSATCHRHAT